MKKFLFVPEFILDSNPKLRKFCKYDNFVNFEEFLKYCETSKNQNFLESLDKESLDKQVFNELGIGKYRKYVSYDKLKFGSDKILKDISPFYKPKIFKDVGIRKSIVLKSHFTFVMQFVENSYLSDNFTSYLIEEDKLTEEKYLAYKFFFKAKFRFDFLVNLISYTNDIIDYNRYNYNEIIAKMPKIRPRKINFLLTMILTDLDKQLRKSIFFYKRESRQINITIEKARRYSPEAEKLLKKLDQDIENQIKFVESECKHILKVKKLVNRNIFRILWDKKPKLKKIVLRTYPNGGIGGELEFRNEKKKD